MQKTSRIRETATHWLLQLSCRERTQFTNAFKAVSACWICQEGKQCPTAGMCQWTRQGGSRGRCLTGSACSAPWAPVRGDIGKNSITPGTQLTWYGVNQPKNGHGSVTSPSSPKYGEFLLQSNTQYHKSNCWIKIHYFIVQLLPQGKLSPNQNKINPSFYLCSLLPLLNVYMQMSKHLLKVSTE